MQKSFIAVLIGSAFFSLSAQAADLIQVYKLALSNDSQYGSARASLAAGEERGPEGLALLLPTIGLSGNNTRNNGQFLPTNSSDNGLTTVPGTGQVTEVGSSASSYHNNFLTLQLTQPLFRWANWQQYQQGKLAMASAQSQFAQAQEDLIIRVAQAYFDVLTAQDNLSSIRAQKEATAEQLASAKRNFEVGTQTITDTHEAQAAFDLVVAQEFAAINDLDNKRTALQAIIGQTPASLATLRTGVTIASPEPAAVEPWLASAEQQNYAVVTAQFTLESAMRDIQVSRSGHYPTADLIASSTRSYITGYGQQNSNAIGVQWSIPLFSGFGVTAKVRESIALEDKARNDLETARRNASLNARQAYLGVVSGLAQVKALEAGEVSSQSALDSNKLGYQVGVRINIDVLNAQKQLYSTQRDLAKARYDTIMNGLKLKSAAGTLKESDLDPVNALLER
jgi:outer membrane protein